jgi:hypothetical protein
MTAEGCRSKQRKEVRGKLRQFFRVLMSYVDFQQAGAIASYVLEHRLHKSYRQDRFLLQGLNTGMIVAYCRPFSKNERGGDTKVPNLPKRFLKILTEDERILHDTVKENRNTVLAHSDSAAWELKPHFLRFDGHDILVPLQNEVHAPLDMNATERFRVMCDKLQEACFDERMRLEPELKPYLDVVEPDSQELEHIAKQIGVTLPSKLF